MAELSPIDTPEAAAVAPAPIPYLAEPLRDLFSWTRYFRQAEIPVLAITSRALEVLRANEDEVDASMIAAAIENDPLMTLKLLAHVAAMRRSGSTATETETVTTSLVMMGVAPFFRTFGLQPTVEDRLHDQPEALQGLRELLQRADRAARFALAFAVHRGDTDAGVIHQAAFLHDFTEMLMWCHAPALELQVVTTLKADSTLRSATVQRKTLNIELNELRQILMTLWRLPKLLVRITDDKHLDQPNVRNVALAVRLARHTMKGWDNAAIPDDIEDIAKLLNAAPRVAMAFVRKVDTPPH